MKRKISYITVEEALEKLMDEVQVETLGSETLPIQRVLGRVLAREVVSPTNIPPRDSSHRDGYAIRAEDTRLASVDEPVLLRLVGKIGLGEKPTLRVGRGEACQITTGALLPWGANAVVPIEATTIQGDHVRLTARLDPGEHVIPTGKDVQEGEVVFEGGRVLRPQDIGLLFALKIGRVEVVRKPVVAIVPVGDELTDRIEAVEEGKLVASHSLTIAGMVEDAGGIPIILGVTPDDPLKIREKLEEGLKRANLTLTIGGCSVGEKDYVSDVIDSMGKPGIIVHGIKRKPGRVTGVGVVDGKPIVLLPGLIQSTVVGFHVFALPIICLMSGLKASKLRPTVEAVMAEGVAFEGFIPFQKVTFVRLDRTPEGFRAEPLIGESALMNIVARADGFVVTPRKVSMIREGEVVEVQPLPGSYPTC
jgi:molybdenum cofactor synthesis domain-containing protein